MSFKEKYGPVALVAGASEGLGLAYAKALAARGLNVAMVARNKEKLESSAKKIADEYQVTTFPIVCDLSLPDAMEQMTQAIGELQIHCFVYNAAASYIGPFLNALVDEHVRIAETNVITPIKMIYALAAKMIEQKRGAIILMSSLAGFQGSGYLSVYAASKAFSRILAESLWYEWKSKGIDVIACCAGATGSPNYFKSNPARTGLIKPKVQTPEAVVEECLSKIGKTPSFVSGSANRFASFLMQHILSKRMAINIMGNTTRKMYRIHD